MKRSEYRACWLCGANGFADPLDRHHIFGGPYRKKSDRMGLVVDLCHTNCHIFGENAVHRNKDTMLLLRQYGQRRAMDENGWDTDRFISEFGRNYL